MCACTYVVYVYGFVLGIKREWGLSDRIDASC